MSTQVTKVWWDGDKLITEAIPEADLYAQPVQEPVAWRTFDGEGGYEYRTYDMNEDYANDWEKRNPNHKGWVDPLYKDPTPCQTCQALARTVMLDQTSHDTTPPKRPWVDLSDSQIEQVYYDVAKLHRGAAMPWGQVQFGRALQALIKELNK
jgi:hypothetical protein